MPTIGVDFDDPHAAVLLGWMADHMRRFPKEYEAAKIVALNRVGSKLNQEVVKTITARYAAKAADVRRRVKVNKASTAQPFVIVRGTGKPIHLGRWPRKIVRYSSLKTGKTYKGVGVQILRQGGFDLVQGGFGANSSRNKEFMIYRRTGKDRYPIEALYGPSMIGHLTEPENQEPLMTLARSSLELELQRQAQFRLKRVGIL